MATVVVGAGIIGLAVARRLLIERPSEPVTVLDKESTVAAHQSGHNSGVIHAGIYYPAGSLKAELCTRGRELLADFCAEHHVPIHTVGKLVVATSTAELAGLAAIAERAAANGVADLRAVGRPEMLEIEPAVAGIAGVHSPSTAIVDFAAVSRALVRDIESRGGAVQLSSPVVAVDQSDRGIRLRVAAPSEMVQADRVVVCGGLQSARLATMAGDDADPQIIPFRGEYYRLRPERADQVRGLIYPVPDPAFPFLGIHLTRRIDGTVDAGPNAVPALALEGYRWQDISPRDLAKMLGWAGFRRLARRHWRTGLSEFHGSISRRYFAGQAARYLPGVTSGDLTPIPAGVRAQAVRRSGELVDDFCITHRGAITFVRNAPSPGATSSLAIAEYICRQLNQL